jgi:hypothetical protein
MNSSDFVPDTNKLFLLSFNIYHPGIQGLNPPTTMMLAHTFQFGVMIFLLKKCDGRPDGPVHKPLQQCDAGEIKENYICITLKNISN